MMPQPQPQVTNEGLDPKEIDGVRAIGNRTTTVYREGHKTVSDTWFSPALQIIVRSGTGHDIFRMANLSRKKPFSSMFRMPAEVV
jgi:hypothetical protein